MKTKDTPVDGAPLTLEVTIFGRAYKVACSDDVRRRPLPNTQATLSVRPKPWHA